MLTKTNYTQVPNEFIDNMGGVSQSAVKVFLAICRKTLGWHKVSDRISYSQLEAITGLATNTLKTAIQELSGYNGERVYILQEKTKLGYVYDINFQQDDDGVEVEGTFHDGEYKPQALVVKVATSKGVVKSAHNDAISIFDTHYAESFKIKFMWDGKQIKAMQSLLGKLEVEARNYMGNVPPPDILLKMLSKLLSSITDPWVRDNLTPALINSKYNELVNQMKNNGTKANNPAGRTGSGGGYKPKEDDWITRISGDGIYR